MYFGATYPSSNTVQKSRTAVQNFAGSVQTPLLHQHTGRGNRNSLYKSLLLPFNTTIELDSRITVAWRKGSTSKTDSYRENKVNAGCKFYCSINQRDSWLAPIPVNRMNVQNDIQMWNNTLNEWSPSIQMTKLPLTSLGI